MTPEQFERDFSSRTLACQPEFRNDDRPVVVRIGSDAHNPAGHLLATTLANLLARAHRTLIFVGDLDRPLACPSPFGASTLRSATVGLSRAINPLMEVDAAQEPPLGALITLGVGTDDAEVALGAEGWCAVIGEGATIKDTRESLLGAGLSAILGAATAFHRVLGDTGIPEGSFSLSAGGAAGTEQGPTLQGPIDVGEVLQVGAGAVGAALDYWLTSFGFGRELVVVDGDVVDATNLNRQILFVARDAGYPSGTAARKADIVAARMGARVVSVPHWYDAPQVEALRSRVFDVVLPLANEGGVRPALQARPQPVLLHATTSRHWTAFLHRHVAGHDDCIVCRLPEDENPVFTCSTADVGVSDRTDASLPFLSAAAGILLATELIKLEHGSLLDRASNYVALNLEAPTPSVREFLWECRAGCRARLPSAARIERAADTRWSHLDGDSSLSSDALVERVTGPSGTRIP